MFGGVVVISGISTIALVYMRVSACLLAIDLLENYVRQMFDNS